MILLALLAVGLLSLSTISLRGSGHMQARAEARANARLALSLAIADLQRAAGPDQRVTAPADIAAGADGARAAAGAAPQNDANLDATSKGLAALQPGTRHWTGVFRNADVPQAHFEKTPSPVATRWLVSGANAEERTPSSAACAVDPSGSIADPEKATILVGPHTAGTGAASLDRYVAVPTVPLGEESSRTGGFAYWVGDEGVKARINMQREPEEDGDVPMLVAQRRGWETVEGFSNYPGPDDEAAARLAHVATYGTASLLLPELKDGAPSPLQKSFHSATVASRGVIADTLRGGLRADLSSALSGDLPASAPEGAPENFPAAGAPIIPRSAHPRLGRLTWDVLQDFYQLHEEVENDGVLLVRQGDGAGIPTVAPTVVDFRILMGVRLIPTGSATDARVHPCGKFSVAIANPYSVPLEWKEDLEFEIKNITPPGNLPSRIWQLNSTCVYIPSDGTADRPGRESAVFNQAIFRIRPDRLEPGEARAFTMSGRVQRRNGTANRPELIDMGPFDSVAPFDFNRCIEVETSAQVRLPFTMDVRESWQTTLTLLEMRLAGSRGRYNYLRRLEGFELDNGYFSPNQRTFTSTDAQRLRGPVPLMLYSFQISQPGMNYLSLMPNGYEAGQRGSTLRTFADFNLRASNVLKPITSYNPPPFFMESNDSLAALPSNPPGGQTGTGFTRNLAFSPLNWGYSSQSGTTRTVLFDVPRRFVSLAQFQHADLTVNDELLSVGHQPGNAFANSYATPFVKRSLTKELRTDYVIIGTPNPSGASQTRRHYYDISHILNTSLWDSFFLSSVDPETGEPENPTLTLTDPAAREDLADPLRAASRLMIEGAFNVNSTDKDAWKAFLASARYFDHPADEAEEAAFPRSLGQPAAAKLPPSGSEEDSFAGFRRLTDQELDALATEIVRQVRLRGPFVSLSHFVNRALGDLRDAQEIGRAGALQLALDESGVNISIGGSENAFQSISPRQDQVTLAAKQGAPRADLDGGDLSNRPPDADSRNPDWARTSRDNNFGAVASIISERDILTNRRYQREQGYRSTGIPGWVTQADVLQVIGPAISARSDTFRIRTMGEARDAAGEVTAVAYCEAIVQRGNEYVDPANAAYERQDQLTSVNRTYGRRFSITSFRWLSSEEI